jgi:ADP-ribose pyrophosphatase YjhB (NUDIX family)
MIDRVALRTGPSRGAHYRGEGPLVDCSRTSLEGMPAGGRARRLEYYHDSSAPPANSMTPTAFAVTRDHRGWVLLVRRSDNGNWELPGGRVELGESATTVTVREVAEEAGVEIAIDGLAGVYSDPAHLMHYPDNGEIRQQFAVCFYATALHGTPAPDHDETSDAAWIDPALLASLPIHPCRVPELGCLG